MKIKFRRLTAQQMIDRGVEKYYYLNLRFVGAAVSVGLLEAAHNSSHFLRFAY